MQREQSQQNHGAGATFADRTTKPGILFLVAVPIGPPDDITLRALRTLRDSDLIAAENPSATRRLLSFHGIDAAVVTSYGPVNLKEKVAVLIDRLQRGMRIALVSDCGSPVIADPGHLLVASARSHGIQVLSVPGPSALTAAVAAAGLPGEAFSFQGHLPESASRVRRCLAIWLKSRIPTVAFCQPASLPAVLRTLACIAPQRVIILACDLTHTGERIMRGTALEMHRRVNDILTVQDITLILMGRARIGKRRGMAGRNK